MPQTQEAPPVTGIAQDWRDEYAYTAGVQAFIYGFPYIYNAKLRHDWVTQARDPAVVPYAAVNQFWHAARLIDAAYRDGGCPNNDALYSLAWLDLRDEPVILSHPDMADRYFTFELTGFTSDNFDYVGQRTTGPRAGHFAIAGPNWRGDLPPEVEPLTPAPTPWVLVLGRTSVDGTADLPDVQALQAQYRLTPLSLWDKPQAAVSERREVYAPAEMTADPLGPWKTLNTMLAENPPPPEHALMLRQFARIGVRNRSSPPKESVALVSRSPSRRYSAARYSPAAHPSVCRCSAATSPSPSTRLASRSSEAASPRLSARSRGPISRIRPSARSRAIRSGGSARPASTSREPPGT